MALQWLDHVNIRTTRLTEMVAFYRDLLGLAEGFRPAFGFPGAWLYLGDRAVVHLVAQERRPVAEDPGIEHLALNGTGLEELRARIRAAGVEHWLNPIPDAGIVQLHLRDPDGNHVELGFPLDELPPAAEPGSTT
jgi:catechol 2,3-dioxygenase-like lactoylglutathione lyase family enzyme